MQLFFFTTSACHLCEQAMQVIEPLLNEQDLVLHEVDIVEHDDLMQRYATAIPVLYEQQSTLELRWPFDEALLREYLLACKQSS